MARRSFIIGSMLCPPAITPPRAEALERRHRAIHAGGAFVLARRGVPQGVSFDQERLLGNRLEGLRFVALLVLVGARRRLPARRAGSPGLGADVR